MNQLALTTALPLLKKIYANPKIRNMAAGVIQRGARRFLKRRRVRGFMTNRFKNSRAKNVLLSKKVNPARRVQQPDRVTPTMDPAVERTLYIKEVCRIDQGTGITDRNRDALFLSGTKVCMNIFNATDVGCIFFNWCIIRPKSGTYPDASQWFRSNGEERSLSFTEDSLSANDYHCRPLNPDDKYILCHYRYKIAPEATGNWGNLQQSINVDKWQAIKKIMYYKQVGEGLERCTTPYFLCYWCAAEGGGNNLDHTNIDCANLDLRIISYFRNPPS